MLASGYIEEILEAYESLSSKLKYTAIIILKELVMTLSLVDRAFIDRQLENALMYATGMHPDDPDESLMADWASEKLFEDVWEELYEVATFTFPEAEDPEEEFKALPEEEQRKHVSAYVDKELNKMSFSDLYEYVNERGYFEVDYDPHEKEDWNA